ncbi:MAG: DUF2334 domain-containing protein [Nitrospinota bacterium]|nr:MAG: DUF2334 domain-containing protein [Nitrospinota bacterium]
MPIVFVRNDDVGPLTPELEQVSTLLLQEEVPVSHAVIPARLTPACEAWLQRLLEEYPDLVEIHQHGWQHLDYGGEGEFGPGRSYAEQYQDIQRGQHLLYTRFGARVVPCFTPPWHRYTRDTLRVLAALRFTCFSTKHTHKIPERDAYPLRVLPVHLNLLRRDQQGWVVKRETEWQSEWQALRSRVEPLGLLLHHEHFRSRDDLQRLRHCLRFLKAEGVVFQKLSEGAKR